MRLLLIDPIQNDRLEFIEAIASSLDRHDIVETSSGQEGLDAFQANDSPFDIIAVSHELPDMSCHDVARKLIESNDCAPLPLLAMLDKEQNGLEEAFEAGFIDCLSKDPENDYLAFLPGQLKKLKSSFNCRNRLSRDLREASKERKELGEKLNIVLKREQMLLHHAPTSILLFSLSEERFTYANRTAEKLFKMPQEQLLKIGLNDLTPKSSNNSHMETSKIRLGMKLLGKISFEAPMEDSKGKVFECEINLVALPSENDDLLRVSINDISERKREMDAIKERSLRHMALAEIGQMGLDFKYISKQLMGSVASKTIESIGPADYCVFAEILPGEEDLVIRTEAGRKFGGTDKAPLPLVSESIEALAIKSNGGATIVNDPSKRCLSSLLSGQDHRFLSAICVPIKGLSSWWGVLCLFSESPNPFSDSEGDFLYSVASIMATAITRDIALKRQVEKELQLRAIIDSSMDPLLTINHEGIIQHASATVEGAFGWNPMEIVDKNISILMPEPYRSKHDSYLKHFQESGESTILLRSRELTALRKDGSTFPCEVSINSVQTSDPAKPMYAGIIRDISDRKKAEQERAMIEKSLHQSEKMEAIGILASGVAHEINTPIQFIGDNIRFVQESFQDIDRLFDHQERFLKECKTGELSPDRISEMESSIEEADIDYLREEIPKSIEQSIEGVAQVAKIVGAMKSFAHPGSGEKEPSDLNEIIAKTLTVSTNEWKYISDMETTLDSELPLVNCIAGDISQVLLNLIINASHAIQEKLGGDSSERGRIGITTKKQEDWAVISIEDTGNGIPEENISRIFEPFFTTKEIGIGSGQGLSIAYSIIRDKHNGSMRVKSEVGKGTVFTIKIPIDSQPNGLNI